MTSELENMRSTIELHVENKDVEGLMRVVQGLITDTAKATKAVGMMKRGLDDVEGSAKKAGRALEDTEKKVGSLGRSINKLGEIGKKVNQLGSDIWQAAGDISQMSRELDFSKYAEDYVRMAGKTEAASRDWSKALYDTESANMRLGRSISVAILPQMKEAAAVAERTAKFVEAHPQLTAGVVSAAGLLAGISALAMTTQTVLQGIGGLLMLPDKLARAGETLKDIVSGLGKQAAGAEQLEAAALQEDAASKQLAAATMQDTAAALGDTGAALGEAEQVPGWMADLRNLFPAAETGGEAAAAGAAATAATGAATAAEATVATATAAATAAEATAATTATATAAGGAGGAAAAAGGVAGGLAGLLGGGVLAGLVGSDVLAGSGLNNGMIMQGLDGLVKSLGGAGFQFLKVGDVFGQGATVLSKVFGDIFGVGNEWATNVAGWTGQVEGKKNIVSETWDNASKAAAQGATSLAALAGAALFGTDTAQQWATAVGEATGAIEQQPDQGPSAADALKDSPFKAQAEEMFNQFYKDNADAESQYQIDRAKEIVDGSTRVTEMESQYQDARTTAWSDFYQQQATASNDFIDQQKSAAEDYAASKVKEDVATAHQDARDLQAFNDTEAETIRENMRSRLKDYQAFQESEAQTEASYYGSRTQAMEDFGKAAAQAEAEHQKQMRRMREDNSDELDELGRSRDALGYVKALRRQEKERQRAEEDYRDGVAQNNAQQAQRLQDMEAQFAAEKAKRLDDYEKRLNEQDQENAFQAQKRKDDYDRRKADAAEEAKYQRDLRDTEFAAQQAKDADKFQRRQAQEALNFRSQQDALAQKHFDELTKLNNSNREQLAALDTRYATEKSRRETAFKAQLDQLDANLLGNQEKQAKAQEEMSQEFGKWLEAMKGQINGGAAYKAPTASAAGGSGSGSTPPPYASGGYAGHGIYELGEIGREFVMNASATSAAERVIGSRLSQEALVAGLVSGRSGGVSMNLGGISIHGIGNEEALARRVGDQVAQRVGQALRKAREQGGHLQ